MLFTKDEGFADLAEDPGDEGLLRRVKIFGGGNDSHRFADLEGLLVL